MDDRDVGRMWDENAEVWTKLARAGHDVYRDRVNTPAFLAMLPDIRGMRGLDIGCGEGHNTRLLAQRGAAMTALDISDPFIRYARDTERDTPLEIAYHLASGAQLPFADQTFDFAVAIMSLMDMPEQDHAIREAFRVLKPGGFFQFSITHPCFHTPLWTWIRDESGHKLGVLCGQYFDQQQGRIDEWLFPSAPEASRTFRIPVFDRTLGEWLNAVLDIGFHLERIAEPHADERTATECPTVADTRLVAYFLIVRCRKAA